MEQFGWRAISNWSEVNDIYSDNTGCFGENRGLFQWVGKKM